MSVSGTHQPLRKRVPVSQGYAAHAAPLLPSQGPTRRAARQAVLLRRDLTSRLRMRPLPELVLLLLIDRLQVA